MKRLMSTVFMLALLAGSATAMADHRHHRDHHHHHRHHRDVVVAYRAAPYHRVVRYRDEAAYWAPAPRARYYYAEPVHYHHVSGHYRPHHGDCNQAFLWIGGAMVLTELIHHAHDGY